MLASQAAVSVAVLFLGTAFSSFGIQSAHPKLISVHGVTSSCRDYKPTMLRLQTVGDSLIKLGALERVTLGPRDSLGVYAAFDTSGMVVAHTARVWQPDFEGADALADALPAIRGKQRPIGGISMLYSGRPMPNGKYAVLQWGLLCAYTPS